MAAVVTLAAVFLSLGDALGADSRPNILLCIADDASWHHFGANGDKVVRTPNFDRVAREGVNFRHAFCSSPSCTPSRGALLTGQHFWRLEDGGNLWSRWPNKFAVYPDLLAKAGYHVGLQGKGWGPGDFKFGGREHNPAGPGVKDFAMFLKSAPEGKPFCFWFGSTDPHRLYDRGSGVKAGLKIQDVAVPPYLADNAAVRSDVLDYYAEIERFDRDIGGMLKLLEERGALDNTLVIITSDNGWPFPRGKATCFDAGTRMPLAIRWPAKVKGGREVDDFVSHTDLAPTFLEVAGLKAPSEMTGRSLLPLLASGKSGQIESGRDAAFFGRERHASVRAGNVGYPIRAIRTREYLYLLNFQPERWPAGDPPLYGDVDQHLNIDGSPTKQAMVEHGGDPAVKRLFDLAFGKRPAEELYDLNADPWQTNNVAGLARHAEAKEKLRARLERHLAATGDPRAGIDGDVFDRYFYVTGANRPQNRNLISLHASNAVVHGTMLRYEPQTNKNCLGYWTKVEDWAEWTFEVRQPGGFEIEVWQGCGKGQGGSEVAVEVGSKRFDFIVEDTGHFQNFIPRRLGRIELTAGKQSLTVKPQRKQAAAVMDIRRVRLLPVNPLPAATGMTRELFKGRRVVFLGDSITYAGEWIEFVEAFLRLQSPGESFDFLNLGLPSETVSGLSEPGHAGGAFPRPDLHERLDRVLAKTKPDVIVACYGMNDGIYHPFGEERFAKFQDGMGRLRAKAAAAGAKVIHVTPPTFDPVPIKGNTLPAGRDEYRQPYEGYNEVLDRYSAWLVSQRAQGWEVVDAHGPMNRFLAERRADDSRFRLAGDGVHASTQGHWLIAREFLRFLGVPDAVLAADSFDLATLAAPIAPEVLELVKKRQRVRKDAWLNDVGHQRPGMAKGRPVTDAEAEAARLEEQLTKVRKQ